MCHTFISVDIFVYSCGWNLRFRNKLIMLITNIMICFNTKTTCFCPNFMFNYNRPFVCVRRNNRFFGYFTVFQKIGVHVSDEKCHYNVICNIILMFIRRRIDVMNVVV